MNYLRCLIFQLADTSAPTSTSSGESGSSAATPATTYDVNSGINAANNGGQTQAPLFGSNGVVTHVISIMMYIVGIVSVIMIIAGGISYATAAGDEAKTKKARKMIVGALIGLVFAILAWTLTNFVLSAL
jgi:hypothetical protein